MTFKEYTDALVKLSEEYTRGVERLNKALDELIKQHKPAEPLIKDEKVRKAVRAWAYVNGYHEARYSSVNNCFCHQGDMLFVEPTWELEQLDNLGYKTIAELCGEEKE